jgi:hypothetical protein
MLAQRSAACAAALLLACATALSASDTTFVSKGARVRVKFEQETPVADPSGAISYRLETVWRVGTATNLDSDTLLFLPEEAQTAVGIPSSKIESIEVSQGKKGSALLGLAVGAGVGVGLALAVCSYDEWTGCNWSGNDNTGAVTALSAALFGGLGAGVGALIKTEGWQEAEFPSLPPVAFNVGNDGSVRLALSLTF